MKNQAKTEADRLFTLFYAIFIDSDSDHSEECIISILSIKCAKTHVYELIRLAGFNTKKVDYLESVLDELEKM